MPSRQRMLGLAFASSDLLLEVDGGGGVVFAIGSSPHSDQPAADFVGGSLEDQLCKASAVAFRTSLAGMEPGRRGSVEVLFKAGAGRVRRAQARLFMLPDLAPNVSCAFAWQGPSYALHDPTARPALSPSAFLNRARDLLTMPEDRRQLSVAFVDIKGLSNLRADGEAGEVLAARMEAAVQAASLDGSSAGRMADERFAVLRDRGQENTLAEEVLEIARSEGATVEVSSTEAAVERGPGALNTLRALRFAVEGCLADGGLEKPELAFSASLSRTLKEAETFRTLVKARDFTLHYQPIVELQSGAVHHFEALARFSGATGPAGVIHMAEELALIEPFDIAVAEKALSRLRRPGAGLYKFAVNVSGASLGNDRYAEALLRMTSAQPEERRRLIVEVTESAAMADLEAANRRLGALREAGIQVCIDDFGSGAASYDYLRALSVDVVKIDGKLIQGIDRDARAQTLVGHLAELCRSMGVSTIAEMIQTDSEADALRGLRVDFGQGWLFGKAEAEPRTVLSTAAPAARRLGAVVGWG